jgi:lysyl-tRNA synthetase class II
LTISYQGTELDLGKPFRRATMNDLVQEATGVDFLGEFGGGGEAGVEAARVRALEVLKDLEDRGTAAKAAGKVRESHYYFVSSILS